VIYNLFKKIDEKIFNKYFKKKYHNLKYAKVIKKKLDSLNFQLKTSEKKILLLSDLIKASPAEGDIVECGVGNGFSLAVISKISKKKIYAFDSFEGFPSEISDKEDKNLSKILTYSKWNYKMMTIDLVKKNLIENGISENDLDKRIIFKKGFFPKSFIGFNSPISFLHLDVDLYNSYKDCLEFFYPKLIKGGIVTFDEYLIDNIKAQRKGYSFKGAKVAIDEFVEKNNLKLDTHYTGYKYIAKLA